MSQSEHNILKALFDIKPVDDSGKVDVAKIYRVQPVVNLALINQKPAEKADFGLKLASRVSSGIGSNLSIANEKGESRAGVDKSSFEPVSGFAPLISGLPMPKPRYATGSRKLYQKRNKNQNSALARNFEGPAWEGKTSVPSTRQQKNADGSILTELEGYLNSSINIRKELKAIGAKVEKGSPDARPRIRPIPNSIKYKVLSIKEQKIETLNTEYVIPNTRYENSDKNYETALGQINERITPSDEVIMGKPREIYPLELTTSDVRGTSDVKSSPEIESWVQYARSTQNFQFPISNFQSIFKLRIPKLILPELNFKVSNKCLLAYVLTGLLAFIIFTSFGQYGISVKNEVMKESNSAVANLEQANENLRVLDFEAASNNFAEAYEEFTKAGESLNFMGASITSLFAESLDGFDKLTAGKLGTSKLKSAKNLIEIGKLMAEAGKSMSGAVNSLSKTGAILKITSHQPPTTNNIFSDLKKSLTISNKNLSKAGALLLDVNPDVLPEDKKESFGEFQSKLPELQGIVSDAATYTNFLENFIGSSGTKKYLVLFQNNSELRPTGGFPGTYAVVTFKDGRLEGFLVDDVYNLDGQLKENIIPPKPLQHITPNWGMRDANWFVDFSVSAQKTMEFFKKEAGYEVDGVMTISPRMISEILKVVGPVEMPEYDVVVDSENFVSAIQEEIEYGDNRQQPKKIVMDMAPKLLEKINSADPGQWLDIFNVFVSGLDKKDILMYFKDLGLESFVADKGFGGLVKNTAEDYLMVTLTNVKGSKTDRVTDNSIALNSKFEIRNSKSMVIHKLTITRQHNGGDSEYGFYNKQNPAYVRVLVPEGAELISISGNSDPNFKPLVSYSGGDFQKDNDLFKFESGFKFDEKNNVWIYNESGKTGLAFWMITDPGEQKTVEMEYVVPVSASPTGGPSHSIYIQKQPGLEIDNFEFSAGTFDKLSAGGSYIYNGEFDRDLEFKLVIDN